MPYGPSLEINLQTFSENVKHLRDISSSNEIIFMVKANAYGHGMQTLSKFAYDEEGINHFGVASVNEACELRDSLKDDKPSIVVFSQTSLAESYRTYADRKFIPVISNLNDLSIFVKYFNHLKIPLFIKFNTGMNRLGIRWDQTEDVVNILKVSGTKYIEHVMSHFANASLAMDDQLNVAQRQRFEMVKKQLRSSGIGIEQTSLANSGAIEQRIGLEESHIRPGLMLYGPSSLYENVTPIHPWKGKLISTLKAFVLESFHVVSNTPIGYGGILASQEGSVAVISIGYADGLVNAYRGGKIPYKSHTLEIIGHVSMDMMHLFSKKGHPSPKVQEIITLWSQDNFKDLVQQTRLSPYETLCVIGSRIPRIYRLK